MSNTTIASPSGSLSSPLPRPCPASITMLAFTISSAMVAALDAAILEIPGAMTVSISTLAMAFAAVPSSDSDHEFAAVLAKTLARFDGAALLPGLTAALDAAFTESLDSKIEAGIRNLLEYLDHTVSADLSRSPATGVTMLLASSIASIPFEETTAQLGRKLCHRMLCEVGDALKKN